MRYFNTEGPIDPAEHYHIPPLERINLRKVLELIRRKKYFVLHAPRQTGKTTALLALRDKLNAEGQYRCVYLNVEGAQAAREDIRGAVSAILSQMTSKVELALNEMSLKQIALDTLNAFGPHDALRETLSQWAKSDPKPIVLMIDEIDALIGDTLLSVLRQLRSGYESRPKSYPQSIILCGVRDVQEYRIHSSTQDEMVLGGSAFNIKAKSLRLRDFSEQEMQTLLQQHTEETGQKWTREAKDEIWRYTQGQPWLVNALAEGTCEKQTEQDPKQNITAKIVKEVKEQLILDRVTHLDQLADKLKEKRVQRVIEPILTGSQITTEINPDNLQYVRDLGLVAQNSPIRFANPIYQEVVPRELTWIIQEGMTHDPAFYVENGRLQTHKLLESFQEFFRENSESLQEGFQYPKAWPHLLLYAYLHRVVNSGGHVHREQAVGLLRVDLLIVWPVKGSQEVQKVVIECKLLRGSLQQTISKGLEQTRKYMDHCGSKEGHLVNFDRSPDKTWQEKIFCRKEKGSITIWGM